MLCLGRSALVSCPPTLPFRLSDSVSAQTIILGFSTFVMTGVCASFCIATCITVWKPKSWADAERSYVITPSKLHNFINH